MSNSQQTKYSLGERFIHFLLKHFIKGIELRHIRDKRYVHENQEFLPPQESNLNSLNKILEIEKDDYLNQRERKKNVDQKVNFLLVLNTIFVTVNSAFIGKWPYSIPGIISITFFIITQNITIKDLIDNILFKVIIIL